MTASPPSRANILVGATAVVWNESGGAHGFVRGEVVATVQSNAATVAVLGVAVGVPVGVLLGRLMWAELAKRIGIEEATSIPLPAVAATLPIALFVTASSHWSLPDQPARPPRRGPPRRVTDDLRTPLLDQGSPVAVCHALPP